MSQTPLETAVRKWEEQGLPLRPPASGEEVESVFEACGTRLSNDVRELYSRIGGFADGAYCDLYWSLWSPAKILVENKWNNGPRIWFADANIHAQIYSLDYRGAESSAVYCENPFNPDASYELAGSLADFFSYYTTDPDRLNLFRLPPEEPRTSFIEKLRWLWNATWHGDSD